MSPTVIGLFVGLLLGIALALGGFLEFLVVAFIGIIGSVVGKVLDGQLDVSQYLGRSESQR